MTEERTLPQAARAELSRLLSLCVPVAASHPRCRDGRDHSHAPAGAPERFSCAPSIPADFTQPLMMLASSLRAAVTDGGSAGLCPLERAEQRDASAGSSPVPLAQGKPSQGTEGQRLCFVLGKQVTVSSPPGGWEASVAAAPSAPGLG